MDKRVVFAVAGSGKTTLLVELLREDSRALVLTHSVNNETHLRAGIIHRFGFLPNGIRVMTWFEFLHGFCCRPLLQHRWGSGALALVSRRKKSAGQTGFIFRIGLDVSTTAGFPCC